MLNLSNIRVVLLAGEEFQRKERLKEILEAAVDPATRDFNLDTITPKNKIATTKAGTRSLPEGLPRWTSLVSMIAKIIKTDMPPT